MTCVAERILLYPQGNSSAPDFDAFAAAHLQNDLATGIHQAQAEQRLVVSGCGAHLAVKGKEGWLRGKRWRAPANVLMVYLQPVQCR